MTNWTPRFTKFLTRLVLLCLLPLMAQAASGVTFSNARIPTPVSSNGVGYMVVQSSADDAITGAASSCCTAVELHTHTMDNGIMRMRQVASVPLKAATPVVFESGGLHVMLIGLKKPLPPGSTVPISFSFDRSPLQKVEFTVGADGLQGAH